MKIIVYALGFAWVAAGAFAILYTDNYRQYVNRLSNPGHRTGLALIAATIGLLLILCASSTAHAGLIAFIGVLGIIKGLLIYFNPAAFYESSVRWLNSLSDQGYRLVGIIALVLGTVIISWIR